MGKTERPFLPLIAFGQPSPKAAGWYCRSTWQFPYNAAGGTSNQLVIFFSGVPSDIWTVGEIYGSPRGRNYFKNGAYFGYASDNIPNSLLNVEFVYWAGITTCSTDSCRVDCAGAPDGFCCIDHAFSDRLLQKIRK